MSETPHGRFMRMPDVVAEVRLSKATINRRVRDGDFPRKRSLGGTSTGWFESDIENWKQNRPEIESRG